VFFGFILEKVKLDEVMGELFVNGKIMDADLEEGRDACVIN
jgi:hypothetical protein